MDKICVFDLDGTVLNTLNSIAYYVNKALEKNGYEAVPTEQIRQFIGHGAKNLITRALEYANAENADIDRILSEYIELYDSDALYLVQPYDGITQMLEWLKKAGVLLGVLSNKPHSSTSDIIEAFFGKDLFFRYEGQRKGVPLKPDPSALLAMLEGFEKENCFYVGDSPGDVLTAKNAGIHSIAVTWGFRTRKELEQAEPEFIAENPLEIADIVLKK